MLWHGFLNDFGWWLPVTTQQDILQYKAIPVKLIVSDYRRMRPLNTLHKPGQRIHDRRICA